MGKAHSQGKAVGETAVGGPAKAVETAETCVAVQTGSNERGNNKGLSSLDLRKAPLANKLKSELEGKPSGLHYF